MKKKIIIILLLLFMFIPNVYASDSDKQSVDTLDGVEQGVSFYVTYNLDFKGVYEKRSDALGIAAVTFEIIFDEDVFTIQGVLAEQGFTANIVKTTDGKYYYVAILTSNAIDNVCADGILFCGGYTGSVLFYTNETTKKEATFKIGEYEGVLLPMLEEGKEISTDDAIVRTGTSSASKKLTIKEKAKVVEKPKESIVENSNTSSKEVKNNLKKNTTTTTKKNTTTNNNTTTTDRLNNHLKVLKIDGYEIDFDKYKNIYSIEVPKSVNSLKITATPEGSKAKAKIIGADNLQENDYKVLIEVTPEEGDSKTYIINISPIEEEIQKKENKIAITDDQIELGKYILIGIAGLIVVIFIIIKIRDIVVEKGIDKL